tara:strand:- start:8529 stop:8750 length:222 start_codon:yes stop_codon:yes gene_type:complete
MGVVIPVWVNEEALVTNEGFLGLHVFENVVIHACARRPCPMDSSNSSMHSFEMTSIQVQKKHRQFQMAFWNNL